MNLTSFFCHIIHVALQSVGQFYILIWKFYMDFQICMTHQTVCAAWFTEEVKEIYDGYLVPVNPKREISCYPEIGTAICVLSTDLPGQRGCR